MSTLPGLMFLMRSRLMLRASSDLAPRCPTSQDLPYMSRRGILLGTTVIGNSLTKCTCFGACAGPFRALTRAIGSSGSGCALSRGTITAVTASPHLSSGTPTTATVGEVDKKVCVQASGPAATAWSGETVEQLAKALSASDEGCEPRAARARRLHRRRAPSQAWRSDLFRGSRTLGRR